MAISISNAHRTVKAGKLLDNEVNTVFTDLKDSLKSTDVSIRPFSKIRSKLKETAKPIAFVLLTLCFKYYFFCYSIKSEKLSLLLEKRINKYLSISFVDNWKNQ